jgi:hypothetical protein
MLPGTSFLSFFFAALFSSELGMYFVKQKENTDPSLNKKFF